jgi:F0F1-type ATP synthase delta subunit
LSHSRRLLAQNYCTFSTQIWEKDLKISHGAFWDLRFKKMKKGNIKLYAKALAQILSQKEFDEKKIINNFVKLLIGSGYESKSKEILNLTQNILLQKQGLRSLTFETARKPSASQKKMIESMVKKGDIVKEKINPELIAGIKVIINNEKQFDNSLLAKLNNI